MKEYTFPGGMKIQVRNEDFEMLKHFESLRWSQLKQPTILDIEKSIEVNDKGFITGFIKNLSPGSDIAVIRLFLNQLIIQKESTDFSKKV